VDALSTVSCKTSTVLFPHVLGVFALCKLVVLLPSIALEVVKVSFVVTIAVVFAEL
jgi:hypothetical protein